MNPQGEDLLKLLAGWDRLAERLAESGGIRGLVRVVLAGMNPQGEDLLKLLAGWDRREN